MRIWLLFGGHGWIGNMVYKLLLDQNEEVYIATSRVDDVEATENEIITIKPTHVISWIGKTSGPGYNTIDYLEQPNKLVENVRDNLFSILVLAKLSEKYNFHLTSGGTGCIFSYQDEIKFNENDIPNFFGSQYSVIKGFTDRLLHLFPNVLNVRIRMPISTCQSPRNFINKIVNYPKIHSIENSMTVLPELLPIMIDLAKKKHGGTINLTNPGTISHNTILEMYKEFIDPNHTWENVESVDGLVSAKRSNNHLDTTLLQTLYPDVLPIHESVRKCILAFKKTIISI